MSRLVEPDLASAWKLDLCHGSPPYFLHARAADVLLCECCNIGFQVVRHEVKLLAGILFGGVDGKFRGRQREDQPIVASIHGRQAEDVSEEGTIRLGILLYTITWAAKIMSFLLICSTD